MAFNDSVSRVKNPLTLVALFASISEISMAVVLTRLPEALQETFIWFVMGFPCALVLLFFFVLYRRPAVFFAPGDYKQEELYVSSIGLARPDEVLSARLKTVEETLAKTQDFLEQAKIDTTEKVTFADVRKSLQQQQELENNKLYAFLIGELRIDHPLAQRLVSTATDAWALPGLIEAELQSRQKAVRLSGLLSSFPNVINDFQSLKQQITTLGVMQ